MKNYLIVGGSSGIGKSLANKLVEEGHKVFATYYEYAVEEARKNITYNHLNVMDEVLDLSFLPDQLDGIAYCPGSINLKPFARIKPEDFQADFSLQVVGAIKVLQAIAPRLKTSENASVVFFSTVAVKVGFNFHSQVAASKGAIEGLTRSLAAEWAPQIRVNCIAPSITDTPLASKLLGTDEKKEANAQRHPLKKIGTPEDIAAMAAFLLSDQSSWMTGQILNLDGGLSSIK
ncbi:SDR family oxidoreductase [uncultured Algoriphagus sp.]|uniref:SDR family NAD(P)-dependent oxidoreductase n=1 Tax=uncultured Algoriphagus sp. TaxID=417365 RepID=UPI0030EF2BCB